MPRSTPRSMPRDDDFPARPANRRGFIGGIGALALGGASALAAPGAAHARQNNLQQLYHDECWTDTPGSVEMTPGSAGGFTIAWQDSNAFICGRGWANGSRRTVSWSGNLATTEGGAYLALYGWTANPLVEYYIVENYQGYRPTGEVRGALATDGTTYDVYRSMQFNAPSVEGMQTYPQYWSVIQSPRSGGVITTGNHFDAWARVGMPLGSLDYYMILAVEGFQSSGSASLRVA